jgi:hypothetical protein
MKNGKTNGRFTVKFLTPLLQITLVYLVLTTPQAGLAQAISNLAPDPQGGMGFNRAHWATSINKMIVPFGTSGSGARGDNSVRAFDPVTNKWEYLWPNSNGASGLPNRDNHGSLYVPRLDEFWVWGGSHLETLPGALCSGRFSVSKKQWIATTNDCYGAFSATVQNFGGGLIDSAMAWSAQADMGLIFGGSEQGNASNRYWIIEPNPAGPQPYKMSEVTGGVRPPPRAQAMNLMCVLGTDFYLFGGYAGSVDGQWTFVNDFWKFDGKAKMWIRLAAPPRVGYQPTVTCDSDKRAIVAWVNDRLYVFDIANNRWSDQTPQGLPSLGNQVGVYAPTAKLHVFEGGNKPDGGSFYGVLGVRLSGPPSPVPSFNIPSRTWVARPYSSVPPGAPGNGGVGGVYGGKHMNLAFNPVNKKVYITGGDSFNVPYGDNQGVWSYDIPANTWTMEYPHCGFQGDIMPGGANESGFVWDSKRSKFWLLPGFWFLGQSGPSGCGGGGQSGQFWNVTSPTVLSGYATYFAYDHNTGDRYFPGTHYSVALNTPSAGQMTVTNINIPAGRDIRIYWQTAGSALQIGSIMTFDPVTKKWANPGVAAEPLNVEHPKNGVYDPVTDSIWRVGQDNSGSLMFDQFNIATNTWKIYNTPCGRDPNRLGEQRNCPAGWAYINDVQLKFEWLTIDPVGRKLYVIDPLYYRLFEFDLNTKEVRIKAKPPGPLYPLPSPNGLVDFTQPRFDTVNNVLLYYYMPNLGGGGKSGKTQLYIFHPDTDTWETDPMYQPEGREVRGNHTVFDSVNNVFMVYGGLSAEGGNPDRTLTHFFIYRYGGSSSGPKSPSRPKSP